VAGFWLVIHPGNRAIYGEWRVTQRLMPGLRSGGHVRGLHPSCVQLPPACKPAHPAIHSAIADAHFARRQSIQDSVRCSRNRLYVRFHREGASSSSIKSPNTESSSSSVGVSRRAAARHLDHVLYLLRGHFQRFCHLFDGWFAAKPLVNWC